MGSMRPSPFANSVEPLDEEAPLLDEAAEHNTLLNGRADGNGSRRDCGAGCGERDVKEFTVRAVVAGLLIGTLLCGSNMHFGLQTGWVTMGSVQSAVLGFGLFKAGQRMGFLRDFTVAENVIVQTTAVATATMPLAAGFVGVVPALSKLTSEENPPHGPVKLSAGQLLAWAAALAFFGVFIAVPLRTQTILREKLRFPSGTATAQIIRTLFGIDADEPAEAVANMRTGIGGPVEHGRAMTVQERASFSLPSALSRRCSNAEDCAKLHTGCVAALARADTSLTLSTWRGLPMHKLAGEDAESEVTDTPWRVLVWTFVATCAFTLASAWAPVLRALPVFTWVGLPAATTWGWVLTPAMGYIGQGMIMGTKTSLSMLIGALLGYAVLGPVAKAQGWAPGEVSNWRDGASGWVIWVSLAVMLGDSIASLSLLVATTLRNWHRRRGEYGDGELTHCQQIPVWWWGTGLAASTAVCTAVLSPMFQLPVWQPPVAVLLALLVAVLAVRALGETDLNPVSGVGKLSQAIFALISPRHVLGNLVAGAVAEAGAQQAGDMMQDFKTAHLLGVCPRQQFGAMLIGSGASVFVSVAAYQLYTSTYQIPGPQFPAPTAEIWLDMAKLVSGGQPLPPQVAPFCIGAAVMGAALPALKFASECFADCGSREPKGAVQCWTCRCQAMLPSGIGIAVGMYVMPRFTLPRVVGALAAAAWLRISPSSHNTSMVILASGLVLGEGTASILTAMGTAVVHAATH